MSIIATTDEKRKRKEEIRNLWLKVKAVTGPVYSTSNVKSRLTNAAYWRNDREKAHFHFWRLPKHSVASYLSGGKLYVTNDAVNRYALLYLDADTHSGGNPEQARTLINAYRRRYAPNMPSPVITERGGSAWLKVDLRDSGLSPSQFNRLVDDASQVFQALAAELQLTDLTEVKIWGKVYTVSGYSVKAGELYKCPPAEEWLDQEAVKAGDVATELEDGAELYQASMKSRSGLYVSNERLGRFSILKGKLDTMFADRPRKDRTGRTITDQRFTEVLVTLCVLDPNADGSNPYERHKRFIQALKNCGDFTYSYCHNAYKAIRDYLSGKGMLDVQSNRYDFGTHEACKWGVNREVVKVVLGILDGYEEITKTGEKRLNTLSLSLIRQVFTGKPLVPCLHDLNLPLDYQKRVDELVEMWGRRLAELDLAF